MTARRPTPLVVLAVLVVPLVVGASGASKSDEWSYTFADNGYVAVRVGLDPWARFMAEEWTWAGDSKVFTSNFFFLFANGTSHHLWWGQNTPPHARVEASVSTEGVPGVEAAATATPRVYDYDDPEHPWDRTWESYGTGSTPAEWVFLFMYGGDAEWDARVSIIPETPGVHVLGVTSGPALYAIDQDFFPDSHAYVDAGVMAGVRDVRDGQLEMDIHERAFGLFRGERGTGPLEMSYSSPARTFNGGTTYDLQGESAGTYTFRVDEWTDACVDCGRHVSLLLADVTLPDGG